MCFSVEILKSNTVSAAERKNTVLDRHLKDKKVTYLYLGAFRVCLGSLTVVYRLGLVFLTAPH